MAVAHGQMVPCVALVGAASPIAYNLLGILLSTSGPAFQLVLCDPFAQRSELQAIAAEASDLYSERMRGISIHQDPIALSQFADVIICIHGRVTEDILQHCLQSRNTRARIITLEHAGMLPMGVHQATNVVIVPPGRSDLARLHNAHEVIEQSLVQPIGV
eukprot:Clim_evm68s128 gene=Clim_evmTU68s128